MCTRLHIQFKYVIYMPFFRKISLDCRGILSLWERYHYIKSQLCINYIGAYRMYIYIQLHGKQIILSRVSPINPKLE